MQCLTASELLSLRLDGALSEEDERSLDAHLSTCASCREEAELVRRACEVFVGVPLAEPAPQFTGRVMQRIQRRSTRLSIIRGGLSLLLLLLILAVLIIAPYRAVSSVSGKIVGTPALISTLVGTLVQMGGVVRSVFGAFHLVMQSVFASSTWLMVLAYLVICGLLAIGWTRLVLAPRRLGR